MDLPVAIYYGVSKMPAEKQADISELVLKHARRTTRASNLLAHLSRAACMASRCITTIRI